LRLAAVKGNVPVEDDGVENESPRQMQVGQENFPKRVKVKHDGVFHPRESSLGKFIVGVWEQIHSGLILEPHVLTEQVQATSHSSWNGLCRDVVPTASSMRPDDTWESFNRSFVEESPKPAAHVGPSKSLFKHGGLSYLTLTSGTLPARMQICQ
jgi:hypothetical protein